MGQTLRNIEEVRRIIQEEMGQIAKTNNLDLQDVSINLDERKMNVTFGLGLYFV